MKPLSSQQVTVSTTSSLSGWEIHEYLGVVTAHVVAGTNIFSDIAASFSDIFGGTSSSYQKQLEQIHEAAVQDLCEQAVDRGGTAIIGLAVDHDEVSGGNRQLLMVTATATVVHATKQRAEEGTGRSDRSSDVVSADALDVEMRIHDLVEEAEEGEVAFDDETWAFIIRHRVAELSSHIRDLVNTSLRSPSPSQRQKKVAERAKEYFRVLPAAESQKCLYSLLAEGHARAATYAADLIQEERLLDWSRVHCLLSADDFEQRRRVLPVVKEAQKRTYGPSDIEKIDRIIETIEASFPKQGEVVEVEQSGMFASGAKEMWVIDGGTPNPMDVTYDPRTGKDIYGFTKDDTRPTEAVAALKKARAVLRRRQNNGSSEA